MTSVHQASPAGPGSSALPGGPDAGMARPIGGRAHAAPKNRALPAWPVAGILLLYPLWWALGLGVLIFPLMAAPMLFLLIRRRGLAPAAPPSAPP